MTLVMIDLGLLVTGISVFAIFLRWRKDLSGHWLVWAMLCSWLMVSVVSISGANMAAVVFAMTSADYLVAGVALCAVIRSHCHMQARVVGFLSMAMMPAHWFVSAMNGDINWTAYASLANAFFVLQCLTIGGWMDELGFRANSLIRRVRFFRHLAGRN